MGFLRSKFFKYVVLPVGMLWGGMQMRYGGPEGYADPESGGEMGNLRELYDFELKDEASHIQEHPYNTVVITPGQDANIKGCLNLLADDSTLPANYSFYYVDKDNTGNITSNYKMTVKTAELKALQGFSDSVCNARHLPPSDLLLRFESGPLGLRTDYNQAYHTVYADDKGDNIAVTASIFKNYNFREARTVIGHELGHKILGYARKCANNQESMERETDADSVGLELTQDPDAFITSYGKDSKLKGITTLFDELGEEMLQAKGRYAHPVNLTRANYAADWKKKHGL